MQTMTDISIHSNLWIPFDALPGVKSFQAAFDIWQIVSAPKGLERVKC